MKIGWQEIATALVVISAAAWLVRKVRRAHRERVVCANCPVPKLPVRPSLRRRERPRVGPAGN